MSRVRTLADLREGGAADEGKGSHGADERSPATAATGPPGSEVDSIMERARARQSAGSQPAMPAGGPDFKITFWKQGFVVNDGPLRRYDNPENKSFLGYIERG